LLVFGASLPSDRVSKNPKTGKYNLSILEFFSFVGYQMMIPLSLIHNARNPCNARVFALLRNLPSTVSVYADECKLLVFCVSLTSASLPKNKFFDRLHYGLPITAGRNLILAFFADIC
jgi:hypothetical protein